jgi:hypothetical protein
MRHITPARLDTIAPLLARLRALPDLVERKRGVFYRRSRAFLHFHEDGDDVYADVRLEGVDFERRRVTRRSEQDALVRAVKQVLADERKGTIATR